MGLLIKSGYLIASIVIGIYLYYWSSNFKKMGDSTTAELNEDEEASEELVDEKETKFINYFGTFAFIIIGTIIWTHLGMTAGKIASDLSENSIIRWIGYVLIYFIFLRFPFGVGNKMVKRSYEFERFPEKIIFVIVMILSFALSICCYDSFPQFLKWHLSPIE